MLIITMIYILLKRSSTVVFLILLLFNTCFSIDFASNKGKKTVATRYHKKKRKVIQKVRKKNNSQNKYEKENEILETNRKKITVNGLITSFQAYMRKRILHYWPFLSKYYKFILLGFFLGFVRKMFPSPDTSPQEIEYTYLKIGDLQYKGQDDEVVQLSKIIKQK